jgi:hypothetical protein
MGAAADQDRQEMGSRVRFEVAGVPDQEDTRAHIKMGIELAYSGELEFVIAIWSASGAGTLARSEVLRGGC